MKEIQAIIAVDRIPSVNAMYQPILRWRNLPGGGSIQAYYGESLSPEVGKVKCQIVDQLKKLRLKDQYVDIDYGKPFYLNIIYILKDYILKRDLDNMNKSVVDAISNYFGFNDSRIFDMHTKKLLFNNGETNCEYIKFYLGQLDEYLSDMIVK